MVSCHRRLAGVRSSDRSIVDLEDENLEDSVRELAELLDKRGLGPRGLANLRAFLSLAEHGNNTLTIFLPTKGGFAEIGVESASR